MEQLILYLDPWSGVSGDMLLAALLDLDRENDRLEAVLRGAVGALGLDEALIEVVREVEWGIACTRVRVKEQGAAPLRHLADMERMIGEAALSDGVRDGALQAVRRLAEVEAAVHGCAVEKIHFHEVGAVDTLVDIVGTFAVVEALGAQQVTVGVIPVGGGTVEIAHGRMGVPAPATTRLLEGYEIIGGPELRELTTPTGALLLGQLGAVQGSLPEMRIDNVGYGAGTMKLEGGPNVLRAVVGRRVETVSPALRSAGAAEGRESDEVVELQTNLDDVSPEVIGHTVAALRAAGALDVWSVPAYMKKDRPGVVVHALVEPEKEEDLAAVLFQESGTLGIRRHQASRRLAGRGTVEVGVSGAAVRVKWGRWQGRLVSVAPEYEDVAAAAARAGLPLKDVMHQAAEEARRLLGAGGPG
jgi:uncharacterized protein (TIGR00299 family) protein